MYFDQPTNLEYLHTLEQFYWDLILISCWLRDLMTHWVVKTDIRLCLMLPLTNREWWRAVRWCECRSHGWWRAGVSPPLAHPPLGVTQGETGMIKQMTPSHPCRRKHEPPASHISCALAAQATQQALIATGSAHSNICIAARSFLYFYNKNISFPSILEINQGRFFFANVSDHIQRRLLPSLFWNWYLAENLS